MSKKIYKNKRIPVLVRMPEGMARSFSAIAELRRSSKSAVIVDYLERYFRYEYKFKDELQNDLKKNREKELEDYREWARSTKDGKNT